MTHEEAIKTIQVAIAEVEWNYPMNYSVCKDCSFRKHVAKTFDIHIDWRDCWNEDCEYKKQKEGETE